MKAYIDHKGEWKIELFLDKEKVEDAKDIIVKLNELKGVITDIKP